MWIEAGFNPDSFWLQTPDTFALAMTGTRKRLEREAEAALRASWHTGAFAAAAQAGKLKPLKHYQAQRDAAQEPHEMLAMLKSMGARSNMTIKRVKRGE